MNIITGYRGEPHITAQEDRDINLGVVGNSLTDVYVLNVGQQLEADIVSANEVRIRDGILVMQGCAASIDYGAYDSLTISNGTQGMLRTDIIAAQYEKDADTNVESLTLVVIEGTPDASDPQAPSLQGGDIQGGDNLVQLPLYQVNIDGVAIDSVEAQFAVTASLSDVTISPDVLAKWDDITGQTSNTDSIMDYLADNVIVEQGTSGDWTYRKWSNGTAECWLKKSFSVTISTVASSWHRGQINNTSIPSGLFIESPLCIATSNSSTYWVGVNGVSTSVIGNIYVYDVVNGASTVWLSVYLIGKWK